MSILDHDSDREPLPDCGESQAASPAARFEPFIRAVPAASREPRTEGEEWDHILSTARIWERYAGRNRESAPTIAPNQLPRPRRAETTAMRQLWDDMMNPDILADIPPTQTDTIPTPDTAPVEDPHVDLRYRCHWLYSDAYRSPCDQDTDRSPCYPHTDRSNDLWQSLLPTHMPSILPATVDTATRGYDAVDMTNMTTQDPAARANSDQVLWDHIMQDIQPPTHDAMSTDDRAEDTTSPPTTIRIRRQSQPSPPPSPPSMPTSSDAMHWSCMPCEPSTPPPMPPSFSSRARRARGIRRARGVSRFVPSCRPSCQSACSCVEPQQPMSMWMPPCLNSHNPTSTLNNNHDLSQSLSNNYNPSPSPNIRLTRQ